MKNVLEPACTKCPEFRSVAAMDLENRPETQVSDLQPRSDGLQPTSDTSDGLQLNSNGKKPLCRLSLLCSFSLRLPSSLSKFTKSPRHPSHKFQVPSCQRKSQVTLVKTCSLIAMASNLIAIDLLVPMTTDDFWLPCMFPTKA